MLAGAAWERFVNKILVLHRVTGEGPMTMQNSNASNGQR